MKFCRHLDINGKILKGKNKGQGPVILELIPFTVLMTLVYNVNFVFTGRSTPISLFVGTISYYAYMMQTYLHENNVLETNILTK